MDQERKNSEEAEKRALVENYLVLLFYKWESIQAFITYLHSKLSPLNLPYFFYGPSSLLSNEYKIVEVFP